MRKRQNHLVYGFSFLSQWQYLRVMRFIYAAEVPITNDTHLSRKRLCQSEFASTGWNFSPKHSHGSRSVGNSVRVIHLFGARLRDKHE